MSVSAINQTPQVRSGLNKVAVGVGVAVGFCALVALGALQTHAGTKGISKYMAIVGGAVGSIGGVGIIGMGMNQLWFAREKRTKEVG